MQIRVNKDDLKLKYPKYDSDAKLWFFQCAYAEAPVNHYTLVSYTFDLLSYYDNFDRSYLRKYYLNGNWANTDLSNCVEKLPDEISL